ncbi:MAG: LytR/AlgR family response regulator transcription factor [Saprospiraceae bacterium]
MTYKCMVVDDEEWARRLLANHLEHLAEFELVANCSNAMEARKALQQQPVDLLFLDIEMPVLKGTDFLKSLYQPPAVIFTTAHRNYAVEGFELNAVDYLLKPITFERFFRATEKFLHLQNRTIPTSNHTLITAQIAKPDFIFIRKDRKQVKVLFDSILYIESDKDYIKIHLHDSTHIVKYRISAFQNELDERFLRIHRSFIINVDKMTAYSKHDVEIGTIEIPIGESYRPVVVKYLMG